VVGVAAVWGLGFLLVGAAGYRSWFEVLRRVAWISHLANGSLLAATLRLFTRQDALDITPVILLEQWAMPIWWGSVGVVSVLAARAILRHQSPDRAWLVIVLASLLVSPLGWIYYVPLAAGPLVGYLLSATNGARRLAIVGYLFLCVPYTLMDRHHELVLSVLVASAGTWGVLALFAAAVMARRREPLQSATGPL
jgi:hypothetical protein